MNTGLYRQTNISSIFAMLMKKGKSKYYVVWVGRQPGIYTSWESCNKQVHGYLEAKYKSFPTLESAQEAFGGNMKEYWGQPKTEQVNQELRIFYGEPITETLCVDAACSGNPGTLEYRGVILPEGREVFRRGPFPKGTTNIGEFLAIVTGLVWLKQNNSSLPVYSDSITGIKWVKMKRINTKLEWTESNKTLFEVVEKAIDWLHENVYDNKILKWETEAWGEIPADFGRK